jgi:hypothetical protein
MKESCNCPLEEKYFCLIGYLNNKGTGGSSRLYQWSGVVVWFLNLRWSARTKTIKLDPIVSTHHCYFINPVMTF